VANLLETEQRSHIQFLGQRILSLTLSTSTPVQHRHRKSGKSAVQAADFFVATADFFNQSADQRTYLSKETSALSVTITFPKPQVFRTTTEFRKKNF
jgi:hypothetical protein